MDDKLPEQAGDLGPLVVGIAGSARKQGNSAALLRRVLSGLGGDVRTEIVFLADTEIRPCTGCHYCQTAGACCIEDGMAAIYPKLVEADAILLASPAYMGGIASRMQAFMERTWPLRKGQLAGKLASCIVTGRRRIGMAGGVMEEYFNRLGVTKLPGVLGFAFESGEIQQDREAAAQADRLAAAFGGLLSVTAGPGQERVPMFARQAEAVEGRHVDAR